jgi:hypothetical protein
MFEKIVSGGAALLVVAWIVGVAPAEAARRDGDIVTGCSRFGRGCVSGPVRRGPYGPEVRLPGGTWYGCAGDCRDTLRAETVDFWDEHQRREGGVSRRGH